MSGLKSFEVAIYNREVRQAIAEGGRHRDLSDAWADIHYIEIKARSEADARAQVASRYPASRGYVIDDVIGEKFSD